jgi:hypothetical protein
LCGLDLISGFIRRGPAGMLDDSLDHRGCFPGVGSFRQQRMRFTVGERFAKL